MVEVLPMRVRFARMAFVWLAVAFAACVTVQVFLAGLATFVDPLNWVRHTNFVHFFQLLLLIMLLLSFIGRFPATMRWQVAGMIGLIYVMYVTANITPVLPSAAAAHPVIAMVIFWLSMRIVPRAWRLS